MNILYKKSLLRTAIAALLLTVTSSESFAYNEYGSITDTYDDMYYDDYYSYDGEGSQEEKSGNFYMSFNYSKANPRSGSFSARESDIQAKQNSSFDYKSGFAGNASIGYKAGSFRVELEGMTSSAAVDIEVENPRDSMINLDGFEHKHNSYGIKILKNGDEIVFNRFQHELDRFKLENKELLSGNFKITNEDLQNKAAMINAYYDINNRSNFTPYFGIGGGLTNIKFFGASKMQPAVQGKLGLNYNINDKVLLSAGYRYFTALGSSSFSGVKLKNEIPTLHYEVYDPYNYTNDNVVKAMDLPGATTATVESKFANHALEVGLKFNF